MPLRDPKWPHMFRLISSYLRLCDSSTLTNLLGFKFQFYSSHPTGTPDSLYKTAAILLKANLVTLGDLFPHLSPSDDDIKSNHKKINEAMAEKVRKMGTVQLGGAKKEEIDISKMELSNNQKFGLCKSLIELDDWDTAQRWVDQPGFSPESDSFGVIWVGLRTLLRKPSDPGACRNGNPPFRNKFQSLTVIF